MMLTSLIQAVINFAAAVIVSIVTDCELDIGALLLTCLVVMPSALMFSAIGFLFGTLFNDKAAPGLCSIIISAGAMVGGIWFDVDGVGGIMAKISKCLPFYYATKLARASIALDFGKSFLHHGKEKDLEKLFAKIDAVTADDIQQVAQELFAPDNLTTLIYQ